IFYVNNLLTLGEKNMQLTTSENILHQKLKSLILKEREILGQIIDHLQIIFDRKLFAKMGYSSIYKYLVKEMGYSEAAAYRRISALKLVREIPETKKLIEAGSISLTNATNLQTILKGKDKKTKKDALKAIKGQSSHEAKITLLSFAGVDEVKPQDKITKVSAT